MPVDRRRFLIAIPLALASFAAPAAALQGGRRVTVRVHKTPWCGCCAAWVQHLRASGFETSVAEHQDLTPVANRLGVPPSLRSCHTAEVGGYFIEGHVQAADIRRLLRERPAARGLAVPGMPLGSPGMEQEGRRQPYRTMLVGRNGATVVWAQH